jgi:hypothetical protein
MAFLSIERNNEALMRPARVTGPYTPEELMAFLAGLPSQFKLHSSFKFADV